MKLISSEMLEYNGDYKKKSIFCCKGILTKYIYYANIEFILKNILELLL